MNLRFPNVNIHSNYHVNSMTFEVKLHIMKNLFIMLAFIPNLIRLDLKKKMNVLRRIFLNFHNFGVLRLRKD